MIPEGRERDNDFNICGIFMFWRYYSFVKVDCCGLGRYIYIYIYYHGLKECSKIPTTIIC